MSEFHFHDERPNSGYKPGPKFTIPLLRLYSLNKILEVYYCLHDDQEGVKSKRRRDEIIVDVVI